MDLAKAVVEDRVRYCASHEGILHNRKFDEVVQLPTNNAIRPLLAAARRRNYEASNPKLVNGPIIPGAHRAVFVVMPVVEMMSTTLRLHNKRCLAMTGNGLHKKSLVRAINVDHGYTRNWPACHPKCLVTTKASHGIPFGLWHA